MTKTREQRFWAKVDTSGDCWIWTAASARGRGVFWTGDRLEYAHRVALQWSGVTIPEGYEVDHKCRVPLCVRPDHLQAVDKKANSENQPTRRSRNATGYRGVYREARTGRYYAQITHHGATRSYSGFATAEEASEYVSRLRAQVFSNSLDDDQ